MYSKLLSLLETHGPCDLSKLAELTGLSKGTLSLYLQGLERRGLVKSAVVKHGAGRPRKLFYIGEAPRHLTATCRLCAFYHPINGCRFKGPVAPGSTACELFIEKRRSFYVWRLKRAAKGYICVVCGEPAIPRPPSLSPTFCLNCLTSYRTPFWDKGDPRIKVKPGVEHLVKIRGGEPLKVKVEELPKARLFLGDIDEATVEGDNLVIKTRLPIGGTRRLTFKLSEVERKVAYYRSTQLDKPQHDLDLLSDLGFTLIKRPPEENSTPYEELIVKASETLRVKLWLANALSHYIACCRLIRRYRINVKPPSRYLKKAIERRDFSLKYESAIMRTYWSIYKATFEEHGLNMLDRVRARYLREDVISGYAVAPAYDPINAMINYVHLKIVRTVQAIEPWLKGFTGLIHRLSKAGKWAEKHAMYLDVTEPLKALARELLLEALINRKVVQDETIEVKGSLGGKIHTLTYDCAAKLDLEVIKPCYDYEVLYLNKATTALNALNASLKKLKVALKNNPEGFVPLVLLTAEDLDDALWVLGRQGKSLLGLFI